MAYKEEYKQEILEQMKTKKIDEIAKETGISKATLYNWKRKEENREEDVFIQISTYMKSGKQEDIEKAKELVLEQMKNKQIDEIVIRTGISKATLYNWKNEKYREEINKRKITQKIFEPIKANVGRKKEDDIENQERLAEANSQNEQIQAQLSVLYKIGERQTIQLTKPNTENEVMQEEINEEQEVIGDSSRQDENMNILTEELPQEEKNKEQVVVGKYVTSEYITGNSSKPKKKTNNNVKKSKSAKTSKRNTIESNLNKALKETISKINCYYYVHMQPNTQGSYEEASRQEKYIKKYDKLQSILECDNANKRAQMELMLVLINEGYREVAKREFPEADYEFIDKIIKGYYAKTIKPEVAKKEIDEYCI